MAALCFISMTVRAQGYEDTIGMYPYFYYGDFPKTGIYHPDSTPCALFSERKLVGYGENITTWPDEYALKMHSDDTLRVIGIACGALFNDTDSMRVSIYDSAMNRLSYTKFKQPNYVQVIFIDTHYHSLHVRGWQADYPINLRESFWFSIFDGKRGEPVKVVGDFYIAITRDYTSRIDIAIAQYFWWENHESPWYFPGCDYRLRYDSVWVDGHTDRSLPNFFPIIDPPCVTIDSVTVEADSAGCVTVRWDSLPMQAHWMVSFGPEGTAAGEGETDTVSERQWRRCGLEPGGNYTVSVRSRCNLLYRQEWSPWSGVWTVTASGNGGSNPEDPDPEDPNPEDPEGIYEVGGVHAELMPNPATGRVRVSCGEALRMVEVYDLQGRRMMAQEAAGTSLDLDISTLAAGRYTVIVHTAEGTGAKVLVVR